MNNIFGKDEVLISCASLNKVSLKGVDFNKPMRKLSLSQENFTRLGNNLKDQAAIKAQETADRIVKINWKGKKTDKCKIITEILLARRYRGGTRVSSGLELMQEKIRRRMEMNQPIRLTISLFPCKIPNRLKSSGDLPDLAEMTSLLRLKEIALAVNGFYKPGLEIIVLTDGNRFKNILRFPPKIIDNYQRGLFKMSKLLELDGLVKIVDYVETLQNGLTKEMWEEKLKQFEELKMSYKKLFGDSIDPEKVTMRLEEINNQKEESELAKKFVALYMSLLYSSYVPEIVEASDPDELTRQVYTDLFNLGNSGLSITALKKKMITDTWQYAINYIAEITAGRTIKPVEYIYPDSIRCDMHNIFGRLTLYPVTRSTRLTSFHTTGYVDEQKEVNVNFRVVLENAGYLPVHGKFMEEDYDTQPFFYVHPMSIENSGDELNETFISEVNLK
jgi:hypothetical protein